MTVRTASPPLCHTGGMALWDSEKAEDLAESLESQFLAANDPSEPTVTEKVMRA
jgi:hypothetical protein